MRMLKSLVVGMGILIVIGMAALAYAVYFRSTNPDFVLFKSAAKPAPDKGKGKMPNELPKPFGDISIELPRGCHIAEMLPDGAGQRLLLRIGPPGQCERVIVVDVRNGTVLGTVGIVETP